MQIILWFVKLLIKFLYYVSEQHPNQVATPPPTPANPQLSQAESEMMNTPINTKLDQMWEVYNRVIKMKEAQSRADAEEIVKLRFMIEDLRADLETERKLNAELKKRVQDDSVDKKE